MSCSADVAATDELNTQLGIAATHSDMEPSANTHGQWYQQQPKSKSAKLMSM